MGELNKMIHLYLENGCNYEYLEDYIIQYAKENKKSVNLDYIKARITDIYNIQGSVWITTISILMDHVLDYLKVRK